MSFFSGRTEATSCTEGIVYQRGFAFFPTTGRKMYSGLWLGKTSCWAAKNMQGRHHVRTRTLVSAQIPSSLTLSITNHLFICLSIYNIVCVHWGLPRGLPLGGLHGCMSLSIHHLSVCLSVCVFVELLILSYTRALDSLSEWICMLDLWHWKDTFFTDIGLKNTPYFDQD